MIGSWRRRKQGFVRRQPVVQQALKQQSQGVAAPRSRPGPEIVR